MSVKDKYGLVAATPIVKDGGQYVGCITMDMPPLDPAPNPNREQVMQFLGQAAVVVKNFVAR